MSDVIEHAVQALNEKLSGNGFDGTAKFVIEDEGAIMLDSDGARAADEDAEAKSERRVSKWASETGRHGYPRSAAKSANRFHSREYCS